MWRGSSLSGSLVVGDPGHCWEPSGAQVGPATDALALHVHRGPQLFRGGGSPDSQTRVRVQTTLGKPAAGAGVTSTLISIFIHCCFVLKVHYLFNGNTHYFKSYGKVEPLFHARETFPPGAEVRCIPKMAMGDWLVMGGPEAAPSPGGPGISRDSPLAGARVACASRKAGAGGS